MLEEVHLGHPWLRGPGGRPQEQLALGTSCRSISADFGVIVGAPRGKDGHRARRPAQPRTSGPETTSQKTSSAVSVFKPSEASASSPEPSTAKTFFFLVIFFLLLLLLLK